MIVERLDNGDFTIQKEPDEELSRDEQNLLIAIAWNVPDMVLLGEPGCAGNYDMYQSFYNFYTDRIYMVLYSSQADWENGSSILLRAQEPDDYDREEIEREWGEG